MRRTVNSRSRQQGVGFVNLMFYLIVGGVALLLGLKLIPAYIEYFNAKKLMINMAASEEFKNGTVADIRHAFDRRAVFDDIKSINGSDLEISKENGETVASVSWTQRISLMTGYTLLVEFSISTAEPQK